MAADEQLPSGTTVLLKGGRVFTPDADWHEPPPADIAVAGDKIAGISSSYRTDGASNIETIDARDHLVLPGFVNAHYHSHDVLAKGTLEEVPLEVLAALCVAAAISATIHRRGLRPDLARCA